MTEGFTRASAPKIPVTIVTGFLGAGKTTLIRNLIEGAGGRRLAFLINEFGEVGIDGEILRACGDPSCIEEERIVELANGCICCTVAEDFLPTMRALIERTDAPDHIVIETSGLALPKPLVQAFEWPEVRTRTTVDGVVAVIDADAVLDGRFATDPQQVAAQRAADEQLDHDSPLEELFEDQLACADLIVINKADLLSPEGLAAVEREIQAHRHARAGILRTSHGRVDPKVLLGIGAAAEDDVANRHSHHDDEEDHDHDEFESFAAPVGTVGSPTELVARLSPLIERHGILRVKGFVEVAGKPMRLLVQAVGGRINWHYDRDWRPGEARVGKLVVIGLAGLDRPAIEAGIAG